MRRLNPPVIVLLLSPLLNPAPLCAATNQLEAERERLKSETRMIKEQIQAEQIRIEQLKRRIELFRAQNRAADQYILKELERYNHGEI